MDKFALTNAIYNMDSAYQKFFKEHTGYPKFKSKHDNHKSYTTNFTNGNIAVDLENGKIKLPKLKEVKAKLHREFHGKIKSATVSQIPSGKYYVSILVETEHEKLPHRNQKIGLDLGIKDLCITSDGIRYENPKISIGKAAVSVKEFYLLPVGDKLIQYDKLAVNTIVENKDGEVSSCDIACTDNLEKFNADYLRYTTEVRNTCIDHDLSDEYMVIGTSAIVNVELDGAVGMNSGIFNNPFMIWGRYRMDGEKALLSISFQFHHTQMDGAHAGKFLKNLQEEIERLPYLLS